MTLRPLHDRLVVERLDEGEQTIGSIIVPDSAKEKPQRGKVYAVGLSRGSRGSLRLHAVRRITHGTYTLRVTITGTDGRDVTVKQRVRVR